MSLLHKGEPFKEFNRGVWHMLGPHRQHARPPVAHDVGAIWPTIDRQDTDAVEAEGPHECLDDGFVCGLAIGPLDRQLQ